MKRILITSVLLSVALGFVAPGMATSAKDHPNLDAAAIRTQQAQIQQEARAGKGRYKDMSEQKRSELFQHQRRVEQLIQDVSKTTELSEVDQIALFNTLESIEAILNQAEDERMVCERHKPVGSNRPQTVCKTVAQRRAEREAAERDMMSRNQACLKGPSGACL